MQGAPNVTGTPAGAPAPGAPNPGVAAWLGLIPGVGAMYNGQFAKAFVHVVIFGGLVVAVSNIEWAEPLFGLLIAFFLLYMIIDAHRTARAMQLGQPAPDMLGLERMFGIQDPQAGHTGAAFNASGNVPMGAVVLIAIGVLFLMGNLGVFQLLHFGKLWPVLLIGLGLWLAYRRTSLKASGGI